MPTFLTPISPSFGRAKFFCASQCRYFTTRSFPFSVEDLSMLVIGICGGVASGKSSVSRIFQSLGAAVLEADRIGHEVLDLPEVLDAIRSHWGDSILANGRVDRKALAAIVFAENGHDDLKRLEAITHPKIGDRIRGKISSLAAKQTIPAAILDAPVMFKAGWDRFCDKIVFVDVPFEVRQQRAMESRGWAEHELEAREKRQAAIGDKRDKSSDIVNNSGTFQDLEDQIVKLWTCWGLNLPV